MTWPDWSGRTAVLVASGPSASDVPLELVRGFLPTLAVKDGWRLAPWADALYGCDLHWWAEHRGVPEFRGLCIAGDRQAGRKFSLGREFLAVTFGKPRQEVFLFGRVGDVGWGGFSGFQAINIAVQLGAKKLILVGFDCRVDEGRHFFGDHRYTSTRPSPDGAKRWARTLDMQAPVLAGRGVDVINCSPVSAISAWPKMTLEEAIDADR